MPRFRLFAVDIDGTLVNSRDALTDRTREAIARALDAGVHVVLATGRRYGRALPLVEPLRLQVPVITASGALIKVPGSHETLYRAHIEGPLLRQVLQVIDEHGYDAMLYTDTFHEGFEFYRPPNEMPEPLLAEFLSLNEGWSRDWPRLMVDPPDDIFACFAMGTQSEMLRVHEAIQTRLPERLYTHVLRSPRYQGFMCEIAPAGVTKWSGIQYLAREWGIEDHEICAVGDDVNDLPMIEAAGLGIAMANAVPEVQAAADHVVPSCDEDGIVEAVRLLLG